MQTTPSLIPPDCFAFIVVLRYVLAEPEYGYKTFFRTASELPDTVLIDQELVAPFLGSAVSSLQHAFHSRGTSHEEFTMGCL